MSIAIVIGGGAAWACELEGDPPTQVPLADVDVALEQAYCDRMFDCECGDGRRYEDRATCVSDLGQRVATLRAAAETMDISYDPACIGALVDELDRTGCDPPPKPSDDEDPECVAPCNPLFGSLAVGEPCQSLSHGSDCAQGLSCDYDCDEFGDCIRRCVDPCDAACDCAQDEWCSSDTQACAPRAEIGQPCEERPCVPGASCERESEGSSTCSALPSEGEPCTDSGACAEDLRCVFDPVDGTGTCARKPGHGDPCTGHDQCATGYCPAGFCDDLPGRGDSCAGTFACSAGLVCAGDDLVCVDPDPAICDASLHL